MQVKAFGLNRSEIMTRLGYSPDVTFPRILGIECVGVIADSVNAALPAGTTVAAVMGEMGRQFDGGYAEYALLPDELPMPVSTGLDWAVFGARCRKRTSPRGARCRPLASPRTDARGRCGSAAAVPRWAWPPCRWHMSGDTDSVGMRWRVQPSPGSLPRCRSGGEDPVKRVSAAETMAAGIHAPERRGGRHE